VSHVLPSFWYRIEHDPMSSNFLIRENLVPECMTHDPSFWYEILHGTNSWAENLGRVSWASGKLFQMVGPQTEKSSVAKLCPPALNDGSTRCRAQVTSTRVTVTIIDL